MFVILDNVQFPRGTTWITRNRFKNDSGCLWMTVPVQKKGLGLQKIKDVRIDQDGRWRKKHLESLKTAYGNAPYLDEHIHIFERVFSGAYMRIMDMNLEIIRYAMRALGVETQVVLLSELGIQERGSRMLVDVCRFLGGSVFLANSGADKYLDESLFQDAGIGIEYVKQPKICYPQLWGDFIYNLSVFDLIFNCGDKSREITGGR